MSGAQKAGKRPDAPVALVTGASGGLGQALAVELDALGCRVAVHYRSSADQARAVSEKLTNDSVVVGADVGSWEETQRLCQEVERTLGPIDVVVNNGAVRKDALMAMQSPEDWHEVIRTNLLGSFHTSRPRCRTCCGSAGAGSSTSSRPRASSPPRDRPRTPRPRPE